MQNIMCTRSYNNNEGASERFRELAGRHLTHVKIITVNT
jgi:hypothetical protein